MHKLKFGIKLFLSYLLFTLILIFSIALVHLYFSQEQQTQQFLKEAKLQSGEKKEKFDTHVKIKKDALLAVSQNEQFLNFIENSKDAYSIDLLFLTLMQANKDYMQMRYISKDGLEVLRFERDKESKQVKKTQNMQDKSQRDYFYVVSKMKQNEIFISNIDLNIEHGTVEIPHKSVIRLATPIYIEKNLWEF